MNNYDKLMRYLQQHAGTERTIAEATRIPTDEVFELLTVLLDGGQVELYQSQSGDEMYRPAPKVHLEDPRRRPNDAPTWGTPTHLENIWTVPKFTEEPAPFEPVTMEDILKVPEPPEVIKPVKKSRAPKKRVSVPFTPLSWDEKESSAEQYTKDYYESL